MGDYAKTNPRGSRLYPWTTGFGQWYRPLLVMATAQVSRTSSEANSLTRGEKYADCAVLGIATLLPVIPFIHRLSLYADDWGLFAAFVSAGDRTVAECFGRYYSLQFTHSRPIMVLYEAVLYRLFGTKPFGYHITNAMVFLGSAWLLYLSLRFVVRQRFLALAIPLVFILLPNYSSARYVPFAFMVGLSLLFLSLNFYAMLRATQKAVLGWRWAILSVAALVLSALAYEVALPLFAASFLIVWWMERKKPLAERLRFSSLALLLVSNAISFLGLLTFKALTTTRYHGARTTSSILRRAVSALPNVVRGAVRVHFYELGLRLPIVALKAIVRYWNPLLFVLALLLGVFVFWYLRHIQLDREACDWGSIEALGLAGAGIVVFALGNAIFLVSTGAVGFVATGVENRIAIAASLGMATIFVALAMWVSLLAGRHKKLAFSLLVALLCSGAFLATGSIGEFWAEAGDQQREILNSVRRYVPTLPPNTTLLIDGACPYIGPGIVFESTFDMGGALQLLYGDPTLRGDVVRSTVEIRKDGIQTRLYQTFFQLYPYGPQLKVYDLRTKRVLDLHDLATAQKYFGNMGPVRTTCPPGFEGNGVWIF